MKSNCFPLALAPAYSNLEIVEVVAGHGLKTRLGDMGIIPGAEIKLVSPATTGPVIIEVKSCRLALGRGVAQRIMVIEKPKLEG
ncbi:MAG: FeoA family protein [Dehalococcoidales bacterium]|nr:FeoA family protein [Dehalococcoidales bacterium]MDD5604836.1 FeoA family protein [Dehalococcoidales bacterium]MDX9986565.1 FeoA family protein [Dehalococcoidales bacterium]NLE90116.1 ferrous iron transport protein A [Dehalococcoidales bacterium]